VLSIAEKLEGSRQQQTADLSCLLREQQQLEVEQEPPQVILASLFFLLPLPVPYQLVINLMLHCVMSRYSLVPFCAYFFDNISLVNSVVIISTFTLLGCIHGEREIKRRLLSLKLFTDS
jgi:hypothetical protein